jgi:F-type H+-transporting ATPase subunit delta
MNSGLVSTRYANALLNFAIESGEQEQVYARMKLLSQLFFEVPELKEIVQNPVHPNEREEKDYRYRLWWSVCPRHLTR